MKRRILECNDPTLPEGSKRFLFMCPGCKYGHCVITPRWSWNGSFEKPTFHPSVLTGENADFSARRCHSFVVDGKIQFLSDCHHDLASTTADLPVLDDDADEVDILMPEESP